MTIWTKVIKTRIYGAQRDQFFRTRDGSHHPRSVLRFPCAPQGRHETEKPMPLMEWLVKTYSNPGELVIDPFAGSGTTAIACINTGRRFWGCELNRTFYRRALRRILEAQRGDDGTPMHGQELNHERKQQK